MSNPLISGGLGVGPVVAPQEVSQPQATVSGTVVVDGTPMRVALLGLSAAVALWGLRQAGFKFNVGV